MFRRGDCQRVSDGMHLLGHIDSVFTVYWASTNVGASATGVRGSCPSATIPALWRKPTGHQGFSSDHRITGGLVMRSKIKPSANLTAVALRLAAHGLHRSDRALSAFLRRKKAQLGAPKAITATAHKLARLIYSMLRYGQDYVDAGAEYYELQYQQRAERAAKRRAA